MNTHYYSSNEDIIVSEPAAPNKMINDVPSKGPILQQSGYCPEAGCPGEVFNMKEGVVNSLTVGGDRAFTLLFLMRPSFSSLL